MDYGAKEKAAARLLKKYGMVVTLRVFTPGGGGGYNPAAGKAIVNLQPKINDSFRSALVVDAPGNKTGSQYGENLKTNSLIQDHNKWIYMDAEGPAPTTQDFILIGAIQYKIFDVQVTGPGGIDILYLLCLRA